MQDRFEVAGHAHLVHTEDGARVFSDRILDQCRVHVEGLWFNVHEDWRRATVANTVGRGNEGMTNRDDFVSRLYPNG